MPALPCPCSSFLFTLKPSHELSFAWLWKLGASGPSPPSPAWRAGPCPVTARAHAWGGSKPSHGRLLRTWVPLQLVLAVFLLPAQHLVQLQATRGINAQMGAHATGLHQAGVLHAAWALRLSNRRVSPMNDLALYRAISSMPSCMHAVPDGACPAVSHFVDPEAQTNTAHKADVSGSFACLFAFGLDPHRET